MKPRHTHLAFALIALATLGGGIAALRFLPDLPNQAKRTVQAGVKMLPSLAQIGDKPAPAAPEPRRPVIKHVQATPPDPPAPREPPPSTISALEALPPLAPLPPLEETSPAGEGAESGVEGEVSLTAPLPPVRPSDLAKLAYTTPLPPRRPWDLAALSPTPTPAAPPAAAPAPPAMPPTDAPPPFEAKPQPLEGAADTPPQPATPPVASVEQPVVATPSNAPLPPSRPADLGALVARHNDNGALQQVARLPDATAPPTEEPEAPARFGVGSPVFIRIFKQEGQLELYLRKTNGRFALYKTFPICKWSGHLGPKIREADYQSPEGFYSVSAKQLHPNSNYHRAFNVGYPNAFDKQNGRTGGLVMVHGACKSVGCFAMTDAGIEEIYGFVDAALRLGQKEIPVHIFPFHMTEQAIAKETSGHWLSFASTSNSTQWGEFWRNLKEGYDLFEQTGEPPVAYACGNRYAFGAAGGACRRVAGW